MKYLRDGRIVRGDRDAAQRRERHVVLGSRVHRAFEEENTFNAPTRISVIKARGTERGER